MELESPKFRSELASIHSKPSDGAQTESSKQSMAFALAARSEATGGWFKPYVDHFGIPGFPPDLPEVATMQFNSVYKV